MLILQTQDLARDRTRFKELGVRTVWEATHEDISAVHLHPKDIGAAIVSVDQPIPPESWRWAGPDWREQVSHDGAQQVIDCTIAARDPIAMAERWAQVLGTDLPVKANQAAQIAIQDGELQFATSSTDVIAGFGLRIPNVHAALGAAKQYSLPVTGNAVTICGTRFTLNDA